jgi:cobalt-precorrin 5A hydrolase
MSERKGFAIFAITKHGLAHAARLAQQLPAADVYVSEKLLARAREEHGLTAALPLGLPMGPTLTRVFAAYDCHVFVISVGAVVRMIAPLLVNKKVDPAVVCVDDAARFAICVLSGHVGRGNQFSERVAQVLGATPVVTTASDVLGTLTVDILGRELGWTLDDPDRNVTRGCAAVVNQTPVLIVQETGEPEFWPLDKPLPPGVCYATGLAGVDPDAWESLLIVSDRVLGPEYAAHLERGIVFRPRSLVLGAGCDRDTPVALFERGVLSVLAQAGLSPKSLHSLASIDKKRDEPAILAFADKYRLPLSFYTAEQLDAVSGIENPSEMVHKHVGTRGVSEPAALLAAGAPELLLPKTKYTEPDAGRSMTVAVARRRFAVRPHTRQDPA